MATYCQAGDIARVTLPDGSSQDFSDTPINVEISPFWGDLCQAVKVFYSYESRTNLWWIGAFTPWETVNGASTNCIGGIYGIRETNNPAGDIYSIQIHSHGTTFCREKGWYSFLGGSGLQVRNASIVRVENSWDGGQIIAPIYNIKIFGNSGTELFNQSYSTDNYSVECVQGCPPNTLDCGDCCLPCDDTYNQISGIRALLSRII